MTEALMTKPEQKRQIEAIEMTEKARSKNAQKAIKPGGQQTRLIARGPRQAHNILPGQRAAEKIMNESYN